MASQHGSARQAGARLRALAQPPYRNALDIVAIATAMAALFAVPYSLALGRATPHHIVAGLVGSRWQRPALIEALDRATISTVATVIDPA